MKVHNDVQSNSQTYQIGYEEVRAVENAFPGYAAKLLAEKYVERNYDKLVEDPEFNEAVRAAAIDKTAEKVADMMAERISEVIFAKE